MWPLWEVDCSAELRKLIVLHWDGNKQGLKSKAPKEVIVLQVWKVMVLYKEEEQGWLVSQLNKMGPPPTPSTFPPSSAESTFSQITGIDWLVCHLNLMLCAESDCPKVIQLVFTPKVGLEFTIFWFLAWCFNHQTKQALCWTNLTVYPYFNLFMLNQWSWFLKLLWKKPSCW